jgi:hypothetical protein
LLAIAAGIGVGGVEEVDTMIDGHVDLASRLVEADIADHGEGALAAHRHGAQGDGRDLQARTSEQPVFHVVLPKAATRERAARDLRDMEAD